MTTAGAQRPDPVRPPPRRAYATRLARLRPPPQPATQPGRPHGGRAAAADRAPTTCRRTCSRPARTRPSPARSSPRWPARGARRCSAGDPAQTYFGSYREVFARDLYESFTGLVASGDTATAKDTVRFLFERQQQPDGSMPRNCLVNGKTGAGLVRDPARRGRLPDPDGPHRRSDRQGVLHRSTSSGPPTSSSRTARRSARSAGRSRAGFSPSTIAAEIAGLTAAGAIAELTATPPARGSTAPPPTTTSARQGLDGDDERPAQRRRRTSSGCPRTATPTRRSTYNLGNGGPDADQRAVIDAGFLELPRLGILPGRRPGRATSLGLVDAVIGRTTAERPGLLPLRHRHAGHRGRVRRLQHRRPDRLHRAGQAVGRRLRRPGAEPGLGPPVAGAVRRARPSTTSPTGNRSPRRRRCWPAWPPPPPASA